MKKMDKYLLEMIAGSLPLFPPLCPNGDLSVKDMCFKEITAEELDYVFSKYKGTMRKDGPWVVE